MTAVLHPATTLEQEKHVVRNTLAASPYLSPEHLLDLDTLDPQSRLLALALDSLIPARPDYATCSYEQAFSWPTVFTTLASLAKVQQTAWTHQSFYVVQFRSKLKLSIDKDLLFALDKHSHREATESGGLLKYWYGSPDSERYNLATCVWVCKEDAVKGGRGPWHQKARTVISKMYEMIQIKGLVLSIEDNVRDWTFSPIVA